MVINPIGDKSEVFSAVFAVIRYFGGDSEGSTGTDGSGSTGAGSGSVQVSVEKFPLSSILLSSYVLFWSLGSAGSGTVTVNSGTVSVGSASVIESSGSSSARGATIVTVPSKMAITV